MLLDLTSLGSIQILGPKKSSWPNDLSSHTVWIFSNNITTYSNISHLLDKSTACARIGEKVNEIASRLNKEFAEIDQKLVTGNFYHSWLASNLGEKNPYQSDFLLNICQTIAIIEAAHQGGRHYAIIDDCEFRKILWNTCKDNGVKVTRHHTIKDFFSYNWIRIFKAFISGVLFSVKKISAARKWHNRNKKKENKIFLLSWIKSDTFPLNRPKNHDSNFGVLPKWIRELGHTPNWLGNPLSWLEETSSIIINSSNAYDYVIPLPALIRYKDMVGAIWGWIFFPFSVQNNLSVAGLDLSSVVRQYIWKELTSSQIIQALLLKNIAKNIKHQNIFPTFLIYTYENQPWEKIILTSFRKHLPNTKLIGVQHSPFSDRYLSVYPSQRQWHEKTTPDTLVTIGENFKKQLILRGAPSDRLVVGGSLKLDKFGAHNFKVKRRKSNKIKYILVSCPMETIEATELCVKAVYAVKNIKDIKVLINFHPTSEDFLIKSVKSIILNLPNINQVEFSNSLVSNLLGKCDLLLYTSSGTVFDASYENVPAIFVSSLIRFDLDKLFLRKQPKYQTTEELNTAIKNFPSFFNFG